MSLRVDAKRAGESGSFCSRYTRALNCDVSSKEFLAVPASENPMKAPVPWQLRNIAPLQELRGAYRGHLSKGEVPNPFGSAGVVSRYILVSRYIPGWLTSTERERKEPDDPCLSTPLASPCAMGEVNSLAMVQSEKRLMALFLRRYLRHAISGGAPLWPLEQAFPFSRYGL